MEKWQLSSLKHHKVAPLTATIHLAAFIAFLKRKYIVLFFSHKRLIRMLSLVMLDVSLIIRESKYCFHMTIHPFEGCKNGIQLHHLVFYRLNERRLVQLHFFLFHQNIIPNTK